MGLNRDTETHKRNKQNPLEVSVKIRKKANELKNHNKRSVAF